MNTHCSECARALKSHELGPKCHRCYRVARNATRAKTTKSLRTVVCEICEKPFSTYDSTVCLPCKAKLRRGSVSLIETVCIICGQSFKTYALDICQACRTKRKLGSISLSDKTCVTCGQMFKTYDLDTCQHCRRSRYNRPMLIVEPFCVYCGGKATCIDHIWPISRGGLDIDANKVSACTSCNSSKRDRLLTAWPETARVAHALTRSAKVRAEYQRLIDLGQPG